MKRIIYILMLVAGLIAQYGCSDFLEADNKSNVTSSEYFNTESGFETLVTYAYAQLKSLHGRTPTMYCSGTDLYHKGRNEMPDAGLQAYSALTPEDGTVSSFYTRCYEGIQAANCVLYYAETVDGREDIIALRSAEARFIRALYYFEMVQQFGGVALVKEYVNSIVTEVPRNSTQEVYDYIITELEALAADDSPLPDTDLDGRVSKQAVYHYLAKAYLTAAWDLDNSSYFNEAAKYAEKAIALGSGLDESFESLWDPTKDNTHQEVIFAIQYDRTASTGAGLPESADNTVDGGNNFQSTFGSYYGGSDQGFKNSSSNFIPSERLTSLFVEGDSRYEATFMTKLYCTDEAEPRNSGDYYAPYNGNAADRFVAFYYPPAYKSSTDNIAAWRAEDPAHRTNTIVIPLASNTFRTDGVTACSYYDAATLDVFGITCVRKYDDPASSYGGSTCYRDVVLARLGETYLIAAEAYLKAGQQGKADEMVNVVRERAFRGSSVSYEKANVTIDDILSERALELTAECHRWTDLRRTKKLVAYNVAYNPELEGENSFIGNDGNQKLYRPIPQSAIDLNTAEINQNQGY